VKAPGIVAFLDNLSRLQHAMTLSDAHAQGVCVRCNEPVALREWEAVDQDEYHLSGFCPDCYRAITPKDCE
jgi:hypothetical protein